LRKIDDRWYFFLLIIGLPAFSLAYYSEKDMSLIKYLISNPSEERDTADELKIKVAQETFNKV
jgi:hypothetical protein